jgi:hypothetical protein
VKEYMEVPLDEHGVYGDWKPVDENAQGEPKHPSLPPLLPPKRKREEVEIEPPVKRRALSEPPLLNSQFPPQKASSQPPPNHMLLLKIDTWRQTLANTRSCVLARV